MRSRRHVAWQVTLGITLALGTACIRTPAKPAANAAEQQTEREARAALTSAHELFRAERFADALQLVEDALSRKATPRTHAELLTLAAEISWEVPDADIRAACQAALAAWEAIPGSDEQVATALLGLGAITNLHNDFASSERHLFRALAIRERLHGPEHESLQFVFGQLIDIYDQQCRVADLERVLERLERVFMANPHLSSTDHYRARFRAVLDRRNAKLDAAIDGMQKAVAAGAPRDPMVFVTTSKLLADYALDAGRYRDHLRFLEQVPTFRGESLEPVEAMELHFAYASVTDPRRAAHDEKYRIHSASAGDELFPAELPPIEACVPATAAEEARRLEQDQPGGWLYRGNLDGERLAPCFSAARALQASSHEVSIITMMRVAGGRVVAAEAAGIVHDAPTLECVARTALGLEVPGAHDFNFVSDMHFGE